MRYIKGLTPENLKMLSRIYRESKSYQVRQRAHCITLSYQRYKIAELISIFRVSRNTIYNWLNSWEKNGLAGLYNEKGRGRKETFTEEEKAKIKAWIKDNPRKLDLVLEKIKKEWGIETSKQTIKRVAKALSMSWHRMRRRVGGKPDPFEYQDKLDELSQLIDQEKRAEIEIRYLDEVGFCLTPNVPYAWQEIGTTETLKSQRSRQLNTLGLLNRKSELDSYVFECSINSEVVVACIDDFCSRITSETVLVMDQASIHRTQLLKDKQAQWRKLGLTIFWLPTYSPQLNLIEILWRKIKYEWLGASAYESWADLVSAVENILKNVGGKYTINFV